MSMNHIAANFSVARPANHEGRVSTVRPTLVERAADNLDLMEDASRLPAFSMDNLQLLSFRRKLVRYGILLRRSSYGRANATMHLGAIGLGVANGAYMRLLQMLGKQGASLPVIGFMGLSAASNILGGTSKTIAGHQRDNQDLTGSPIAGQQVPLTSHCRRLAGCSAAVFAATALLAGLLRAFDHGYVSAELLLGVSIAVKSSEVLFNGLELGQWHCVKTFLGNQEDCWAQRQLNRTIIGLEDISLSIFYNAATIASYLATSAEGGKSNLVMRGLLLGCLANLGAKTYFLCGQVSTPTPQPATTAEFLTVPGLFIDDERTTMLNTGHAALQI